MRGISKAYCFCGAPPGRICLDDVSTAAGKAGKRWRPPKSNRGEGVTVDDDEKTDITWRYSSGFCAKMVLHASEKARRIMFFWLSSGTKGMC